MSNIFRSSFVPGFQTLGILPSQKVESMANSNFQPKVSKNFIISYLKVKPIQNTNSYKRNGKPLKQNTGSFDRLNKLKAIAMK